MDEQKIACIMQWPSPQSAKELRGFLGLIDYYRRFIKSYGVITQPFTTLLKKSSFLWSSVVQEAFDKLKSTMIFALVLALPNFSQEFSIEADASNTSYGVVLSQNG